jgi:hypothetical protein
MAFLLRLLPLGLVAMLTACGPVYRVWAEPRTVPIGSAEPNPRRLLGTWALTDNDNLLFNLLLRPDGSALSAMVTLGSETAVGGHHGGVRVGGGGPLEGLGQRGSD